MILNKNLSEIKAIDNDYVCLNNPLYKKINSYIKTSTTEIGEYLINFNQKMHQREVKKYEYGLLSRIFLNMDETGFKITQMKSDEKLKLLQLYSDNYNLNKISNSLKSNFSNLESSIKNIVFGTDLGLNSDIENLNLKNFKINYPIVLKYFQKHLEVETITEGLVQMMQITRPNKKITFKDTHSTFFNLICANNNRLQRGFNLIEKYDIHLSYLPISFLTMKISNSEKLCKRVRTNINYIKNNTNLNIEDLPKRIFKNSGDRFSNALKKN